MPGSDYGWRPTGLRGAPETPEMSGFTGKADAERWIASVCPAYSTDIAAAWEVVEKVWATLPKTGYGTFRALLHRRDPDGRWICEFAPNAHGDWRTHATAEADTAPLAICLAALRAVGAEVTP
jgi:hypothetical protein